MGVTMPEDLLLQSRGGAVGTTQGNARQLLKALKSLLAIAREPLANGLGRGGKEPRGGLDAMRLGMKNDPQSQVELVRTGPHTYHQFPIGEGFHLAASFLNLAVLKEAHFILRVPAVEDDDSAAALAGALPPAPA
jgi:hypothetical protein